MLTTDGVNPVSNICGQNFETPRLGFQRRLISGFWLASLMTHRTFKLFSLFNHMFRSTPSFQRQNKVFHRPMSRGCMQQIKSFLNLFGGQPLGKIPLTTLNRHDMFLNFMTCMRLMTFSVNNFVFHLMACMCLVIHGNIMNSIQFGNKPLSAMTTCDFSPMSKSIRTNTHGSQTKIGVFGFPKLQFLLNQCMVRTLKDTTANPLGKLRCVKGRLTS